MQYFFRNLIIIITLNLTGISFSQKILAPQAPEYWNIQVKEDGIYRIKYSDLTTWGINPANLDFTQIQVSYQGQDISVFTNKTTGNWKNNDYLEFYGTAPKIETGDKDPYTRENVYQLYINPKNTSIRYQRKNEQAQPILFSNCYKSDISSFMDTKSFYYDIYYRYNIKDMQYPRIWYWCQFKAPTTYFNYSIQLPGILDSKDASVRVSFKALLQGESHPPVRPNHHARFNINGNDIGEAWWNNQTEYVFNTTFPVSFLNYKLNTVAINAPGDIKSNPPMDQFLLAGFDFTYPRKLEAYQNQLIMPLPPSQETTYLEIKGFTSPDIIIWDLENAIRILPAVVPSPEQKSQFNARFAIYSQKSTRLYAATDNSFKSPVSIHSVYKSRLKAMAPADYIIITYDDFTPELKPLVQLRQKQGHTVAVVKISDIYNEFNYGRFSPEAIKTFTQYAWDHWDKLKIKNLFLVGDANWDYLNVKQKGAINYVPTTIYTYFASDNYYGVMDTTSQKPAFAIGRLPARTPEEVKAYVNKVLEYEHDTTDRSWSKNAVLVAGYEPMFTTDMNSLAKEISSTYQIVSCYAHPLPEFTVGTRDQETREDIQRAFRQGAGIMAFVGHGSLGFWADRQLLTSDDVPQIKNPGRYPLVLSMTCYTGRFEHDTDTYGICELLVKQPEGGAIAALGSTGRSSVSSNSRMMRTILRALISQKVQTIGEAVFLAKQEMNPWENDQLHSYVLLGDPALKFKLPPVTGYNNQ